jgi:serine/threonine protein kinase
VKGRRTRARPGGDHRVDELSRAVTDRRPIDWEGETGDTPHTDGALRRLRQIESLRDAHARIAASLAPGEAPAPALFEWGPLRVIEKIGEGGFGEVYRALDTRLDREVALKLHRRARGKRDAGARRFLDEARRLARVRHSNVLVVHGADIHAGRAGFWTDLVHGRTLAELLDRDGPLAAGDAAAVGVALCRALHAVHRAGFIHGDVKAANVMREDGGRIVLMDFGAASLLPGRGGRG